MFYQTNNKDMYHSYDTSNSHIYTEPLYAKQRILKQQAQQQQQQQQQKHDKLYQYEEEDEDDVVDVTANNCIEMGLVYGLRKRQLSCIEEGDSDSLHSTSLHAPYEMIKDVDESFKQLVQEMNNSYIDYEDAEADQIEMIDESRQYDSDYLDEINSKTKDDEVEAEEEDDNKWQEDMWQSTFSEPTQRMYNDKEMFPDIMATSCYGALNTSFGSESLVEANFSPLSSSTTTAKEADALYATPIKRRDLSRFGNSPSQSQTSNSEPLYSSLMTTSLDLKCMSDYIEANQNCATLPEDAWLNGVQRRNISKNLVDEFDVVAEKCLSGAENGKLNN